MIEEVKKILNDYEYDNRRVKKHYKLEKTPDWLEGVYAQRICLLFEPERDYEERVEIDEGGNIVKVEPEPDEGGLLTDEECRLVELRMGESLNWCQPILKAQRDLTASKFEKKSEVNRALILSLTKQCEELDAECQSRVDKLRKACNESLALLDINLEYNRGKASEILRQALKKKEVRNEYHM